MAKRRVRLVERRRWRRRLEGPACGGRLHADATATGPLRQPVVVAQRGSPGHRSRIGPRVPRAAAGGGELLRASLVAANGGEPELVTTVGANATRYHPQAWSSDGTRLIYPRPWSQDSRRSTANDLVSTRLDGTERRRCCACRRPTTWRPRPTDAGWPSRSRDRRLRHGRAADANLRAAPKSAPRKPECRCGGCRDTAGNYGRRGPTQAGR